jgi:transcriptional regulator with XRE-family HTH domain
LKPSFGTKIIQLRKSLQVSQAELGRRLGVSPMAVSRWERSIAQPVGTQLIGLGNLAYKDADSCWFFWNLAGLMISDVMRVLPIARTRMRQSIPVLRIVNAGAKKRLRKIFEEDLVAVPFLRIVAAAGMEQASSVHDLTRARADKFIAAPRLWCPNPKHTVCMRVKGDSMEPTLFNGYIIVVDQAQTDKKKLNRKMIVAHHNKFGLVVSRFCHLKHSEALVSDNRSHHPVPFSPPWRIVGTVLWWIGEESGGVE